MVGCSVVKKKNMTALLMPFFTLFLTLLTYVPPICSQLPGYLSLDVGYTGVDYEDENGILWTSDSAFVNNAGEIGRIQIPNAASQPIQMQTLRYFPGNLSKYCYRFPNLTTNASYFLRTTILYGNFDLLNKPPLFLYILDGTPLGNIVVQDDNTTYVFEFYFKAQRTFFDACVAKLPADEYAGKAYYPRGKIVNDMQFTHQFLAMVIGGVGVPFINSLEFRPLGPNMYENGLGKGYSLHTLVRTDFGPNPINRTFIRYPFDPYDRRWRINSALETISTDEAFNSFNTSLAPPEVMRTARTSLLPSTSVTANFSGLADSSVFVMLYFAEIENVTQKGERVFDIYMNIDGNSSTLFYEGLDIFDSVGKLKLFSIANTSPILFTIDVLSLELRPWLNSTRPPLINALEIFEQSNIPHIFGSNPNDVEVINLLQEHWNLTGWTGDPCLPSDFSWEWLTCTSSNDSRIIAMHLSSFNLSGGIPSITNNLPYLEEIFLDNNNLTGFIPNLSMLTNLKKLRLDNNDLSGTIPDFLGWLPKLEELSLQNNNFSGEVPTELIERASNLSLNLRISGNPLLISPISPVSSPSPSDSTTQNTPPSSPTTEATNKTTRPSPSQGQSIKVTFQEIMLPLFFITFFIF